MMLIRNGRLIDPSRKLDVIGDVLIIDGKIAAIGTNLGKRSANRFSARLKGATARRASVQEIDAEGLIVAPGFIDIHTHLREPGFEYKETVQTGAAAAVAGGFCAVACMANTAPVNDNAGICSFIKEQALKANLARVYPIAAISVGIKGEQLTDFSDLLAAGAVAFSDDGKPLSNPALMRRALEYASSLGATIISHCEDLELAAGGVANEGFTATILGLRGSPMLAEDLLVAREIMLAESLDARVHIAHLSSARALRMVREAKRRRVKVSAEATPHHLFLGEEALLGYDTNTKVNPPLRGVADVQALREGLGDGTIDCIASDHAPHSSIEKDVEFDYAASGMVGLETTVGLALRLVEEGILDWKTLVAKLSCNPARVLNIPGGTLKVGVEADLTLLDPRLEWVVDKEKFHSKGRNTPFQGWCLRGKAVMTIVGGAIKFVDESIR